MTESVRYVPRGCVEVKETEAQKEARRIAKLPQPTNQIAIFRDVAGKEVSFPLFADADGPIVLDSDLVGLTYVCTKEKSDTPPPVSLDLAAEQRDRRNYIAMLAQNAVSPKRRQFEQLAKDELMAQVAARRQRRGLA